MRNGRDPPLRIRMEWMTAPPTTNVPTEVTGETSSCKETSHDKAQEGEVEKACSPHATSVCADTARARSGGSELMDME